jgi:hypothetical protein
MIKKLSTVAMESKPKEKSRRTSRERSGYVERQPMADTEDGAAPVRYSIICLVGLFGLLLVMYIVTYIIKRYRRQGMIMEINNIPMKADGTKEGLEIG